MATTFTDPLNVLDPNGGLGKNWIQGTKPHLSPIGNPVDTGNAIIGVSSKDSLNCLQWNLVGNASPNQLWRSMALPVPTLLGVYGLTQFSQCTLVQTVAANGEFVCGPLVCGYISQGSFLGYTCYIYSATHGWFLRRYNNGVETTLASGSGIIDGDIIRLSADLSIGGQVTLIAKQNNSTLSTYIDSSSNRIIIGSPGLMCQASVGSSTPKSEWRTFSCGTGL